ncbi:MAG: formate dehydrogenase accessory protein FdhE [Betaproteobacteria bacterium]|nr:formate dehydrogenase accessory protein FdhE [Betaproteobacteria bacterium]
MARAPIRIVTQEEIAGGLKEPPAFRLAKAVSVFADRASRFEVLAAQGAGEPAFLQLMAKLAHAQQSALQAHAMPPPPAAQHLERCARHGLPPLGTDAPLGGAWRDGLKHITDALRADVPPTVRQTLVLLDNMNAAALDTQASRLLSLDYPALDAPLAPFIGAALQVHWVKCATTLGESAFKKLDVPTVCPVCGSPPLASVLHIDAPVPGTRYLHCVLCASAWHMVRGTCSQCEMQDKLAYYHVEGGGEAVRGEACDECKGYIKSFNQEKDPQVDPVADDLASLSLDILMDESGYQRASPNFLFVPGQG